MGGGGGEAPRPLNLSPFEGSFPVCLVFLPIFCARSCVFQTTMQFSCVADPDPGFLEDLDPGFLADPDPGV